MKESWIKKLLELLNEYENEGTEANIRYWNYYQNWFHFLEYWETYSEMLIISKKYGFIWWLVENDKIDRDNQALQYAKSDLSKFFAEWKDKNWMSDDYAMLLMLLAIQDEPIRFLCEILK